MKKLTKLVLASTLAATMVLPSMACGGGNNQTNEGKNSISVCIASEPDSIDPALNSAVDGATMIIHSFAGLVKYNDKQQLVADCAKALPTPVKNPEDGSSTYTFELKDGLKWNDGSQLKASDFEYSWKRAASTALGADYGYMFDVIKGWGEEDVNGLAPLAVTADDTANTLTVTLNVAVPYWFELCAFPTYMPVKKDVVASESWATKPETFIGNGPYKLVEWKSKEVMVFKKNEHYHDAASITMPEVRFHLSDDDGNMLANYKADEWQFIDSVPNNEIDTLKAQYQKEFFIGGQLGTYYAIFNNNENLLPAGTTITGAEDVAKANIEIRKALSLLLDRNYICEEIGKAGQMPASSFVAKGLTDASAANPLDEFYLNAGDKATNGYVGYYDVAETAHVNNVASAVTTLKKYFVYEGGKFTNFPKVDYLYNAGTGHKNIGEYIQQAFAGYGITIELKEQEWATFLNTRKDGNYTMARNGWLGDYNDPISFLDMWTTGSGNNDAQFGREGNATLAIYSMDLSGVEGYANKSVTNGTWAQTYDALIGFIKAEETPVKRFKLMHAAEDLLMSTGSIVPLYFYTDIYMCKENVKGFFASPLGYKYFMYTTIK